MYCTLDAQEFARKKNFLEFSIPEQKKHHTVTSWDPMQLMFLMIPRTTDTGTGSLSNYWIITRDN